MKKTLVNIKKIKNRQEIFCEDTVALETEYSLFVNGQKLVRLSCTPADLKELALGRLYTEGLVRNIRKNGQFMLRFLKTRSRGQRKNRGRIQKMKWRVL